MYKSMTNKDGSSKTIYLNGKLTIQNAKNIHECLVKELKGTENIFVSHKDAEEFDLTYLQILISANKYQAKMNKKFSLLNNHPEEFMSLLKDTGCAYYDWMFIDKTIDIDEGNKNG